MILGLSRSKGPAKAFSFPVSFASAGRAEAQGGGWGRAQGWAEGPRGQGGGPLPGPSQQRPLDRPPRGSPVDHMGAGSPQSGGRGQRAPAGCGRQRSPGLVGYVSRVRPILLPRADTLEKPRHSPLLLAGRGDLSLNQQMIKVEMYT